MDIHLGYSCDTLAFRGKEKGTGVFSGANRFIPALSCLLCSTFPNKIRSSFARKDPRPLFSRLWEEFERDAESIADQAESAYERFTQSLETPESVEIVEPVGPTEVELTVRTRRVQSFFRQTVLVSYEHRCALTGISVAELLNASHIIPWNANEQRRADPRNGLCLNVLHDRAFDRGLLTFDEDLRAVVSALLKTKDPPVLHAKFLLEIEGTRIQLPARFEPDREALEYHRVNIFRDG